MINQKKILLKKNWNLIAEQVGCIKNNNAQMNEYLFSFYKSDWFSEIYFHL